MLIYEFRLGIEVKKSLFSVPWRGEQLSQKHWGYPGVGGLSVFRLQPGRTAEGVTSGTTATTY
jgi:hypothetical protein